MSYSHDHEASQDFSGGPGLGPGNRAQSLEDTNGRCRRPRRSPDPSPLSGGPDRGRPRRIQGLPGSLSRRDAPSRPRRGAEGGGAEVRPGSGLILLDANALIALLRGEPAEGEVAALLRSGECATPAPCLAEVVDRLIRRAKVKPGEVVDQLEPLIAASLGVLAVENRIAWQAGELRGAHYNRNDADLSLADCLLLASAAANDEIATSDLALATTARALDLAVIPLPDSGGSRPSA